MNKKFSKFIHEKINIKENKRLYLKSIFNKKLSVEELVDISNELNIPYANMLRLYLSGIKNYSYAYIVNIIDNNDLNSIKEMILNNGLIVGDNAIYINNEALSGQRIPLLFHHYQKILHILLIMVYL